MERLLKQQILKDLERKIILISGPRQTGKTTLSKSLLKEYEYFNYDKATDQKMIRQSLIPFTEANVILDEIHKMKNWKSWLKGHYDTLENRKAIIVTGSAKLDTFKKAGDSLAGRFFQFRLLPLDIKEVVATTSISSQECLDRLLELSGFPEPFLLNNKADYLRWRSTHLDVILKQDILSLENIKSINSLELLIEMMSERVGSLISYNSLREDLTTDDKSIKRWFEILENSYILFKVTPYSKKINRAISKAPKYYFYDVPRAVDEGARFENLVALSLYKETLFRKDVTGEDYSLHFLRNRQQNEVDFLICHDKKPIHLIECKSSDKNLDNSFELFEKQLGKLKKTILVKKLDRDYTLKDGTKIVKAHEWLATCEL